MSNSLQVFNHRYPSDISREQFEIIRPILENFKKQTKPRTIDLYDIFCGLLYVLKSGCQWRMLPSPMFSIVLVFQYFQYLKFGYVHKILYGVLPIGIY